MKKNSLKFSKAIYLSFLMLFCQSMPVFAEKKQEQKPLNHYLSHIVYDILQTYAALGIGKAGISVGQAVLESKPFAPNSSPVKIVAGLATALGLIAGSGFIIYKAPQWTDTYCLGYKTERTRKQNIVCFASNLVFLNWWPIGIPIGELLANSDNLLPD